MPERSLLVDRRVAVAVVVQIVGYAALLAVFGHTEPTSVVEALGVVPTVVLVFVSLPAIPATVFAIVVGAVLSFLGIPPETIPALLLARGDAIVFASAYAVAVASAWAYNRGVEPPDS